MRKDKTIADIAYEHLKETNNNGVMYGDCGLLDEIAHKCTHTTLIKDHPLNRHARILQALEKDKRFEKYYFRRRGMIGNPYCRIFSIKE